MQSLKSDIKRFLALYFEASMNGEQMPDADGEQFYELDLMSSDEIHKTLQEGYEDVVHGNVQDAASAFAKFRERH